MATLRRPGSYVDEVLNPAPVIQGDLVDDTAVGAFVAPNDRGSIDPYFCGTWSDYVQKYGTFNNNNALPYAVYAMFANGGKGAWLVRAAGAGYATATISLNDRQATPAPLLKVDADNPGLWGNTLFVAISDVGTGTGRFNLEVYLGSTAAASLVERWTDLSMNPNDRRYAPSVVNEPIGGGSIGSNYVRLTNIAPVATNLTLATSTPAVTAGTALAGGLDGAVPSSTDLSNAATRLDAVNRPLVLNMPGVTDAPTLNSVTAWAEARQDVFVVIDTPVGLTGAQAITAANALTPTSYAAVYFPWVNISDPAASSPGVTRLVPPGGAIVGRYLATDRNRGVHKAPAGIDNRIAGAVSTERRLSNAELDSLNTNPAPVNAIRQLPGAGICVMGARTLKPGQADKYVPVRRTLIYLRREMLDRTTGAIFQPNDGVLWAALRAALTSLLTDVWVTGGLRGTRPQDAFYVKCDASINTPSTIAEGRVLVEVGVALQFPAEFVVIRLGQFEGGASVTESQA